MRDPEIPLLELRCTTCSWCEVCGPPEVAKWLRRASRLRRDQQPEIEIMHEVLKAAAGEMTCPECGHQGLHAAPCSNDDDWPEAVACTVCRKPIDAQRLAAVPGTRRCTACQQADERGEDTAEVEYCPRCGAAMELRQSRGSGLTRYVMRCTGNPPCRT